MEYSTVPNVNTWQQLKFSFTHYAPLGFRRRPFARFMHQFRLLHRYDFFSLLFLLQNPIAPINNRPWWMRLLRLSRATTTTLLATRGVEALIAIVSEVW